MIAVHDELSRVVRLTIHPLPGVEQIAGIGIGSQRCQLAGVKPRAGGIRGDGARVWRGRGDIQQVIGGETRRVGSSRERHVQGMTLGAAISPRDKDGTAVAGAGNLRAGGVNGVGGTWQPTEHGRRGVVGAINRNAPAGGRGGYGHAGQIGNNCERHAKSEQSRIDDAANFDGVICAKGDDGKFLWPGYGDNIRVLKWIFGRVEGTAQANETPIGYVPPKDAIDITGLSGVESKMDEILKVDNAEWLQECELIAEHQVKFGDRLPAALKARYEKLKSDLNK